MLSIDECRKYLIEIELSDDEVEKLRDAIYCIVENIIEEFLAKEGLEHV